MARVPAVGGGASTPTSLASEQLAEMTPNEVVKYFGLDEIKLADTVGTTPGRIFAAILTVAFFSLSFPIGAWLVSLVSDSGNAHLFGALALWLVTMAFILQMLVVSVPEITGLVTVNLFTGTLRAYSTGFQVKYLWEQAKWSNYINLRLIPTTDTIKFVTSDGVQVTYTYTIQYRGRLRLLGIFIRVAKKDIDAAIGAIVRFVVSQGVMGKKVDELRSDRKVRELQDSLSHELGQDSRNGHELEYRYAVDLEQVSLSEPTFADEYIEATTTEVLTAKINSAGRTLMDKDTGLGLTGQSAADAVMMLNKEGVKKEVKGIEATDLATILGNAIAGAAQAIAGAIANNKREKD